MAEGAPKASAEASGIEAETAIPAEIARTGAPEAAAEAASTGATEARLEGGGATLEAPGMDAGSIDARIRSGLGPIAQSSFSRMTEGARRLASSVYETMYKIPGVNRVVGKLEVAYNEMWMKRHESKAAVLKTKFDVQDMRINMLTRSRDDLRATVESLRASGTPGADEMLIRVNTIEEQITDAQNRRDIIQTKIEKRSNKERIYTNQRDEIADRLIGRYREKLVPIEARLENINTVKSRCELMSRVHEARNEDELRNLEVVKDQIKAHENILRESGSTERAIRNDVVIKQLSRMVLERERNIEDTRRKYQKEIDDLNKRAAVWEKKAAPHRDKVDRFVRIKARRPVVPQVPERLAPFEHEDRESVAPNPRVPAGGGALEGSAGASGGAELRPRPESMENRATFEEVLKHWNEVAQNDEFADIRDTIMIRPERFVHETGIRLNEQLSVKGVLSIMDAYCVHNKVPKARAKRLLEDFHGKLAAAHGGS